MPRHCDVIIEEDLVDNIKPGDRVEIFGVYRPMPKPTEGSTNGVFPTRIIGNNLRLCNKDTEERQWTGEDIKKFKEIASRADTYFLWKINQKSLISINCQCFASIWFIFYFL